MVSLARFSIRRPKLALAVWLVVGVALTLIGLGVSSSMSPSVTVVPGTQSSRAQQLANAQFGPTQLVPILLEGPKAQLDRQGPALVRALDKRAHTRVLSAWDGGDVTAQLRRSATAAMLVVSVDRSEADAVKYDQPAIDALVSRMIKAPVKSYVTGQPSIDRAVNSASLDNLKHTELIAIGILFVLLLIGLRAPVAAALVTAIGAISTFAGFGAVAILGHLMTVNAVAVALGSMTGLALGVGFALLIVDRFRREEHTHHMDAVEAAVSELETTGRAVLVGGSAVVLGLALVALVGPTELMISLGTGMLTCAMFAIGGAVVVMPAALVLLGRRIEAFSFSAPAPLARAWSGLVGESSRVTRRPVFAGFFATLVLAVCAVPALALSAGPQTITQLPGNAKARIAFEEVSRVMGPGMATPYNLIVVAHDEPITTPSLMSSIERFQTEIAGNNTVYSVTGPGAVASTASQLQTFGPSLRHSAAISDRSKKDLLTLIKGLGKAGAGSQQLQSGLATASTGAGELHSGSGRAQSGAEQLHTGLAEALSGAVALQAGAKDASIGAEQLASGLAPAPAKAGQSVVALRSMKTLTATASAKVSGAANNLGAASRDMNAALAALGSMTTGKSDARYGALASALQKANGEVAGASGDISAASPISAQAKALAGVLAGQAPDLVKQLRAAANGAGQLAAGIKQLRNGNGQLATGLTQLSSGAGQLESGLSQLTTGAGQLASGLAGGVSPAGQLTSGLGRMKAAVITARGQIPSTAQLKELAAQSPGLFSSGYFVLAAVAGAPTTQLIDSTFTVNTLRGGGAGQIVVTSKYPFTDSRSAALGSWLVHAARRWARIAGVEVAVGGPAGSTGDLTSVTKSRIWLDVVVLTASIVLILALALRAVLLPLVATAFSLLVVAATFGVLQLLFGGVNPPLGGPGWIDPMSIIGIFTIALGVTAIYTALLLMRTREALVAGEPTQRYVQIGLRQTAAAATGTGLVMVAALIPFSMTDLVDIREFGIGVAVAVLLDILILRPVLLPAAEALLGRFGWWPTRSADAAQSEPKPSRRTHRPPFRPRGAVHP
jgi:putative drug exporter of the RND superfamily